MKVENKERQALVANIESGQYKKVAPKQSGGVIAVAVMVIIFMLVLLFGMIGVLSGRRAAGGVVGILFVFFMFITMIAIVATISSKGGGADLGKLTEQQRWLILNGEAIEADLDAIDQMGNLYTLRASAEYKGQKLQFASPAIAVKPIPFEERKITVYVRPDNPNYYLVDFYSHLPLMGDDVLRDRSEMKCEPSKAPGYGGAFVVLVICSVILGIIGLFMGFVGLAFIAGGHGVIGLLCALTFPGMMGLTIAIIAKGIKTSKDVMERGFYVMATGTRFWVTKSKDSTTYHLASRYIEPSTKRMHEFRTTGPSSMRNLQGAKVKVYINPDNMREYYVDIKSSLQGLGFTTSKEK